MITPDRPGALAAVDDTPVVRLALAMVIQVDSGLKYLRPEVDG